MRANGNASFGRGEPDRTVRRKRQSIAVSRGTELNHMALRMEPASHEEVKARLEEEGIEVAGRPGDDTCIYFDDSEGHRLQLLYKGHD